MLIANYSDILIKKEGNCSCNDQRENCRDFKPER